MAAVRADYVIFVITSKTQIFKIITADFACEFINRHVQDPPDFLWGIIFVIRWNKLPNLSATRTSHQRASRSEYLAISSSTRINANWYDVPINNEIFQVGGSQPTSPEDAVIHLLIFISHAAVVDAGNLKSPPPTNARERYEDNICSFWRLVDKDRFWQVICGDRLFLRTSNFTVHFLAPDDVSLKKGGNLAGYYVGFLRQFFMKALGQDSSSLSQ